MDVQTRKMEKHTLAWALDKILFVRLNDRNLKHLDEYCEENGYTRAGFLRDIIRVVDPAAKSK